VSKFGEAGRAFRELDTRTRAAYPDAVKARKDSDLVAFALDAVTAGLAGLSLLISSKIPDKTDSSNDAKIDQPVVQLRDFCRRLVAAVCEMPHVTEALPELAKLRAQLEKDPAPGMALADAGYVLLWVAQHYLTMQLMIEVSKVAGLRCETVEDHVDEAARSVMPESAGDTDLARMKQHLEDDCDCDPIELLALRQDIRRRRKRIENYIDRGWPGFQDQLDDALRGLLSVLEPESPEAAQAKATRASLSNPKDPSTRQAFKKWFTMAARLGLADDDGVPIREKVKRKSGAASAEEPGLRSCRATPRQSPGVQRQRFCR